MAVRDNVTLNNVLAVFSATVSSDTTTTTGAIVDTAAVDCGVSFFIGSDNYTDGTYTLQLVEGDESNLSDATVVPAEKLILVDGLDAVNTGISAQNAAGGKLFKVGVFSNKRYVRANVVSTGTTTGADIQVSALVSPEILAAN